VARDTRCTMPLPPQVVVPRVFLQSQEALPKRDISQIEKALTECATPQGR
jgi:hypothetical protein